MDHPTEIAQHTLNSEDLASLIRCATELGNAICFNAPGKSMSPLIRSGDKILVAPVNKGAIHLGDVLAFTHPENGRVLAHRVVRISEGRYFCKADNVSSGGDGWISVEDVLGRVTRVERDGREHHLGLGAEKWLIALLSRGEKLVPLLNSLRKIKWGFKRVIN